MDEKYKHQIVITTSKKAMILDLDDIEFLQSRHCYTQFVTTSNHEHIMSSKPIKYYEELLANKNFIRIHNQFLVNKRHIKEILSGTPIKVVLTSGIVIPVTKFKKNELIKQFYLV